jgi:hypothetical protein
MSAPETPHPSVLTQIPAVVPLHAQNSLTQTKPTLQLAVSEQRTGCGFAGSSSTHLNLAESKQTPLPSDSLAHAQDQVPLLLLQGRRNSQLESQAVDVQTPFVQALPVLHLLLHRPQWSLDLRRSWQLPLQRAAPLPVQMVVGVGRPDLDAEEVRVTRVDD